MTKTIKISQLSKQSFEILKPHTLTATHPHTLTFFPVLIRLGSTPEDLASSTRSSWFSFSMACNRDDSSLISLWSKRSLSGVKPRLGEGGGGRGGEGGVGEGGEELMVN